MLQHDGYPFTVARVPCACPKLTGVRFSVTCPQRQHLVTCRGVPASSVCQQWEKPGRHFGKDNIPLRSKA